MNSEILPCLSANLLTNLIKTAFQSEVFDAPGEESGYPLYERYEDRKRPGTNIEGIIPLLTRILNKILPPDIHVTREKRYPCSDKRCDLVLHHANGKELWIELKQYWTKPCTPYETAFDLNDYLNDIRKFSELPEETERAVLLLSYQSDDRYPEYPSNKITELLGDTKFAWEKIDMPTAKYGPCTCHILLWQLPQTIQTKREISISTDTSAHSGMMGDDRQKSAAIDALVPFLDQLCKGNGGIYRFHKPEQGKRPAYYGYYLQKRGMGWVLICWSDEFENVYSTTPYWIELEKQPARKLPSKYRSNTKLHPSKFDRLIIPVPAREMQDPVKVASKVFHIATDTMM